MNRERRIHCRRLSRPVEKHRRTVEAPEPCTPAMFPSPRARGEGEGEGLRGIPRLVGFRALLLFLTCAHPTPKPAATDARLRALATDAVLVLVVIGRARIHRPEGDGH